MNSKRILIIGLDGASPHLINKWSDSLPNLQKLITQGVSGVLQSVLPPRSIPAWYCFATGMNPAKLGVFGFSQRIDSSYDYTFANMTFCMAPPFWNWLNQHGIKTALIHIPGTYPPTAVDGTLVSGWPGPLNRGNLVFTDPPDLSREIDKLLGQPFEFLSPKPMRLDNDDEMLQERLRILEIHGKVARHVLKNSEWQVGTVVFSPLDRASHQFWRHFTPEHPAYDEELALRHAGALKEVYKACDKEVGALLEFQDPDTYVFIISDHGFGPANRVFYLNEWLHRKGYLVLKEQPRPKTLKSWVVGNLAKPIFRLNNSSPLFRKIAAPLKKRTISNYLRNQYIHNKSSGLVRLNHLPVDWSKTRAYCPDEGSLYLNLQGRDPEGVVGPREGANILMDEIIAELQSISDPNTNLPIPVQLHRKEDIYNGPYLEHAPDLLVAMDNYATEVMAEFGGGNLFVNAGARSGTHTLDGLFIANGPDVKPQAVVNASLLDIIPSILHIVGVPISEALDGKIILEMFEENAEPAKREPVFISTELSSTNDAMIPYSNEEAAQVEERLRDLGYLG